MIRVFIKWDFISPVLRSASGMVEVHYVKDITNFDLIAKFKVKVEDGSTGYESVVSKGIPTIILDAIKPQLDAMVRSYHDGITLCKNSFFWSIDEDIEFARERLKELNDKIEKGEIKFLNE